MTYNFDPDRWYEIQRALIDQRRDREDLEETVVQSLIAELDRRYEELLSRLDGTYQIPATAQKEQP